jgi:hypothetical protein
MISNDAAARIMAGTVACLFGAGVYFALRTGKMVNLADPLTLFTRRDRPRYYWYSILMVGGLSAFCAYLAIFAPP